ncbi:hypothetical protein J3E69DRAFT_352215 [Trichoderma sp. SZMC 28015]
MESSGADKGFFQRSPSLVNQFYEDATYQRCFKLFLPAELREQIEPEVAKLGQEVLADRIFAWITDAERNKPYLKGSGRNAFGQWQGKLIMTEGQFLRLFLWEGSSANVTCPTGMQDGAARMLQVHLTTPSLASKLSETEKRVFENAFRHLTTRDPKFSWTSGQWMTERPGGSDVSLTETTAVYRPNETEAMASKEEGIPLGPWSINGFKWFSSATDSDMTILLARTPAGKLSTFLAPLRKHDAAALSESGNPDPNGQCLNGVRIQRLKNKLGTQSLPTAELVLEDMRGWIIGEENRGIQEISVLLHLTRIHSTSQAVGYLGRGLAIARAFARVREVGAGRGARMRLTDSSLHMKTLARMTAEYRRIMLLHMFTVYILGLSEHPTEMGADITPALKALTPPPKDLLPLLRVLSTLTKAYVCNSALRLLYSCMESMGGVGYLLNEEQEYLNIARLYRDAAVLPIWEGTTDLLSTDFIRALKRPETGAQSLDALDRFIKQAFSLNGNASNHQVVRRWDIERSRITKESHSDLVGKGRDTMWSVTEVLMAALLHVDATNDGNVAEREILQRYLEDRFSVKERVGVSTREELEKDFAIVYGEERSKTGSNLLTYNVSLAMASQTKIERMIHKEGSGVNFGAHISNVDLENASETDIAVLAEAFYKYQVLVLKNQQHLSPRAQYEFTERLNSAASMGHGNKHNLNRFLLSPDLNTVPHQPQVQIIGNGFVPEHEGAKNLKLRYPHHRSSHSTTIADEEDMEFTRFYRWHIDAALYDDAPPVATTILAVTLPKRRMQTVRYDDGTGDELPVPLGTIAFASGETTYDLLSEEDKVFVRSTKVEYAAHPYIWMGRAKSHPTGLGLISEGTELDDDQLPPIDPASIQILPMCWRNPVTNRLALQVHAAVARRLHLANGEVIDDLERLQELRPFVHRRRRDASHELLVTEELAKPLTQGGIVVALLWPSDYHPFSSGVDVVVEESPTLRALRDVFALIGLDLVQDITVLDSLPFLRETDRFSLFGNYEEYKRTVNEHHEAFLDAVAAKRPDVVLCMWQTREELQCHRSGCSLASKGVGDILYELYAKAVAKIQNLLPELESGDKISEKLLYDKLTKANWTQHINDASLCLRAASQRLKELSRDGDNVEFHHTIGPQGDMFALPLVMMKTRMYQGSGFFTESFLEYLRHEKSQNRQCWFRNYALKSGLIDFLLELNDAFSDAKAGGPIRLQMSLGKASDAFLTLANKMEGLLGTLSGYPEQEQPLEDEAEQEVNPDVADAELIQRLRDLGVLY